MPRRWMRILLALVITQMCLACCRMQNRAYRWRQTHCAPCEPACNSCLSPSISMAPPIMGHPVSPELIPIPKELDAPTKMPQGMTSIPNNFPQGGMVLPNRPVLSSLGR